jgi:serine/threonine protein kinase
MKAPQSGADKQSAAEQGAAGREPLRRWDPERIGPYVILGRLGAGSMGRVYLGRSPAGRLVAVKTIRVDLAEEEGFRTRFAQEVAAARRVSGFFTAAVVEADPDADLPWLATAYVAAPSLSRLVRACGPLPVAAVRWLAAGCAEALDSIHRVGLVHRDLKPSNVLVAVDGPRVIDFGVARVAERMGATTSHGTVGTPAYMAPEQARDIHQASAASDVYSLGATLVFAATGQAPYRGDTVMDVLARLATEEPDLSALPAELAPLIAACMQRVPRERPTSSAVLARLGQFTEGRPGAAGEHSYLPESAMALIAQYQHNPLLAAGPSGPAGSADTADTEDSPDSAAATSPSYTQLPAAYQPKPRGRHRPERAPSRPAGWPQWIRTHLAWVGWVSVGAALVVGGVILGASLSSSGSPSSLPPPLVAAPQTVCDSAQAQAPQRPDLCMVQQSQGTASTAFVIQGRGFAPGASVTFTLHEIGPPPAQRDLLGLTSPYHATVEPDGTFRVEVSQLYSGPLQQGEFTVDASVSGSSQASTRFMVIPAGPPPGGALPTG